MAHDLKYDPDTFQKLPHPDTLALPFDDPSIAIAVNGFEQNLKRGQYLLRLPEFLLRTAFLISAGYIRSANPTVTIKGLQGAESPTVGFEGVKALYSEPPKEEAVEALESLLVSVLLNAWTAFEVLAVDVWMAAVNARPMSLGKKAMEAEDGKGKKRSVHPEEKIKADFSSIKIDILREHGFNLSNKLGTVLYDTQKYNFNRLDGIQYAYSVCFGQPVNDLFSSLLGMSELEAIRNVFVHRAGVVDKNFIQRMDKSSRWSNLKKDDDFPIDAEVTIGYLNTTTDFGKSLIALVNKWLCDNAD